MTGGEPRFSGVTRRVVANLLRVVVAVGLGLAVVVAGSAASWASPATLPLLLDEFESGVARVTVTAITVDDALDTVTFTTVRGSGSDWASNVYFYLICPDTSGVKVDVVPGVGQGGGTTTDTTMSTLQCAGGTVAAVEWGVVNYGVTVGYAGGAHDLVTGAAPASDPSTCSAFMLEAEASYLDGDVTLYFRATSVPRQGWRVFGVESATAERPGGSGDFLVGPTEVDGWPSWYGTVSAESADDWTHLRVEPRRDADCWQAVAISTTVEAAPGDVDNGHDESGFDCGLNPFCYIKAALAWAFVPSEGAVDGWQESVDELTAEPPLSLVVYGGGALGDLVYGVQCMDSDSPSCAGVLDTGHTGSLTVDEVAYSQPFFSGADDLMSDGAGLVVYNALTAAIWFGFIFWAWRRVGASFGGRDGD